MKSKIILVVMFLSAISFAGYSQAQFAIGLKGGLNLSKFNIGDGASNVNNRTGYHGGAFALIKITSFGIQPEVLFSKQGSKFTYNATDYEANFDYVAVPVILKLYLPLGLNIQAGPQFGFNTLAELKKSVQNVNTTQDAGKEAKKSDISVAFGAGWDLPFGITIDARYVLGVKDMKFEPNPGQPVTFKNKVVQISLGYKLIKLGK